MARVFAIGMAFAVIGCGGRASGSGAVGPPGPPDGGVLQCASPDVCIQSSAGEVCKPDCHADGGMPCPAGETCTTWAVCCTGPFCTTALAWVCCPPSGC